MKIQSLKKTVTILSITIGLGSSLSAAQFQMNAEGKMELPTFYVYASDSESADQVPTVATAAWSFEKTVDLEAEPVSTRVVLPGGEIEKVYTPGISISLIKS